jgi:S1-C subfamily serine protease/tetratricopeptide (TPR) repeat protein
MLVGVAIALVGGVPGIRKSLQPKRPAAWNQIPQKFETLETLAQQAPSRMAQPLAPDQLFAAMSPAVAQVHVMDASMLPCGQGTGFFVSADGLLVTNWHVIDGAAAATIVTPDGISHAVEGVAASNKSADLALLKVRLSTDRVPTLNLAPQSALPVIGTRVFAIGNPKGLTNTLSDGLVSGHRDGLIESGGKVLQISAPISPGSSGGPLFTPDGAVIGVTSSGFTEGQNLNFAVPVEQVRELVAAKGEPVALAPPAGSPILSPRTVAGDFEGPLTRADAAEFFEVLQAMKRGDYRTASRILNEIRPRNENTALYWHLCGMAHAGLRHYGPAELSFRRAIELDERVHKITYPELGRVLMYQGREREAIEAFRTATKLDPTNVVNFQYAGICSARMGDMPRALKLFDHAIKLDADDPESHRLRGQALLDLKRTNEGFAEFDQALRIDPRNVATLLSQGHAFTKLKRHASAADCFRRAVAADPKNAGAYLSLGDSLDKMGRQREALAAWTSASRVDPNGPNGNFARLRLKGVATGITRIE